MTLDIGLVLAAFLAGAVFGALHLSLLRVATRALAGPRPARVFIAFAILRTALVVAALAGLAALGAGAPEFVAALAGFLAARIAATRMVRDRVGKEATWK
ncbi:ATP synthase subunit I [Ruegeria marina]|uniref:F1/F0 ATPase, subunit 2 n=1 Tax=Ruegeria marina TaxID=639004 RepID=A0A1G6I8S9_9RHOB|nr:ATP synthase subunit I [Ruegeria marina]SDC02773.1 F1/F0 ATPase, subunit 2 [Ruegeria marina]